MIYAVISDVHANAAALTAVLDDAFRQGAEKVICLGDIVGYGPMPAAALSIVRERCDLVLAGNHDDAVSGRMSSDGFINLAGDAVKRHREELSAADLKWLRELPYICEGDGFAAAHGDLVEPEKFFYVEDEEDSRANFERTDAQLMFVGHTHVPRLSLIGASGTVYVTEAQDFTMEDGKRYIVNPGSVGYPRERGGKCHSSYVLYDSVEKTVEFRYLPFSVSTLLQRGGSSRRRVRIAVFAAVICAVAAIASAVVSALTGQPDVVVVESSAPELLVESSTVNIGAAKKVAANLRLARSSCPLQLSVTFKGASGETLGVEKLTVKRSSMRRFPVPDGAAKALFELRKNAPGDLPVVDSFLPAGY